ncbi:MAG: hypothetical protein QF391_14500 [Myxococcota bacterium]|nr:hypothetical protein [Myxococcota bacterium]
MSLGGSGSARISPGADLGQRPFGVVDAELRSEFVRTHDTGATE